MSEIDLDQGIWDEFEDYSGPIHDLNYDLEWDDSEEDDDSDDGEGSESGGEENDHDEEEDANGARGRGHGRDVLCFFSDCGDDETCFLPAPFIRKPIAGCGNRSLPAACREHNFWTGGDYCCMRGRVELEQSTKIS
nr:uncharacterized protein LOC127319305 [Lolium perenne]